MEIDYSEETVQMLIDWAKERVEHKDYPQVIELNRSTKIVNCGTFFQSVVTILSSNKRNVFFYPLVDKLRQVKELLEASDNK